MVQLEIKPLKIINKYKNNKELIRNRTTIYERDTVRAKGGMSLRNGMWNDVRNGIIMRNTRYTE